MSQRKELAILEAFYDEIGKVRQNQRSLILITSGFIELFINTVIDLRCKHGKKKITSNTRDYSLSIKLVLLSELNLLDERLYTILDWFRKLRNRAAHDAIFELKADDIEFANKSMDRFLPAGIVPSTGDLYRFCTLLIGTVWNLYLEDLVPVFEQSGS